MLKVAENWQLEEIIPQDFEVAIGVAALSRLKGIPENPLVAFHAGFLLGLAYCAKYGVPEWAHSLSKLEEA